ncbi:MAG: GAF domain-containing protein [Calothrix sp. C42_A2020_038]|nr:GAF domain-containing protein [Calothrix sp. C42_A2020_038]
MKSADSFQNVQQSPEQESLLYRITDIIRQGVELQAILDAVVVEVRKFLQTERVMVYKFDDSYNSEVIAESIEQQRFPSLLRLHFPASDVPSEAREMLLTVRQGLILDIKSGKVSLLPLDFEPELQASANIQYRTVEPCDVEYLKSIGIQSSLVLPIRYQKSIEPGSQDDLWGLLVSHYSRSRAISKRELQVLQQFANQMSIAITLQNSFLQARVEQRRQTIINQVITQLHSLPTIQLQAALETTVTALSGCGGRMYIYETGDLYQVGEQPLASSPNSVIEEHPFWQHWMEEFRKDSVWAITDIYAEPELGFLTTAFQDTNIRGLLVMPLGYYQNFIGIVSIFRNEDNTKILWARQRQPNPLNQQPQTSFTWRQKRQGKAPAWKQDEITLAQTLAYHISMSIQQDLMYHKLLPFLNIEQQVQVQTSELEKSLLITNAIRLISEQIRSSLDLTTTLHTIVREVRKILNTDRVLIYQFNDPVGCSDGKVIVEEINGNWQSTLAITVPSGCFPDKSVRMLFEEGVRVINNVATASLSACHREFLESLQIQANLIVPIHISKKLWGLLIAHQCEAPRLWHDDEIELLQQLADQAAIAIQQAELYEQSRASEAEAKSKAMQLGQALYDLQQTQTQLIQNEKMSSLGQLVAGIAHEINNPINFIYGNLSHTIEYTQQLLELLKLYQQQCPSNNLIESKIEEMDLDFITADLPKTISSMQAGAERIRSIILSLRNFSRLDEADMKPVDLHEGIDNTLLILQHRFKSTVDFPGIQVIKKYGELPLVECYAGQINQVFVNILGNAVDALIEKFKNKDISQNSINTTNITPRIVISTAISTKGKSVVIRIADNGNGIPEDVRKRVFDPFFTTKDVGKGTGLGLAISYQIIVEKHGGVIKCASKPNQYTEFMIEIPLKQVIMQ